MTDLASSRCVAASGTSRQLLQQLDSAIQRSAIDARLY
jgi:hypothetical protein